MSLLANGEIVKMLEGKRLLVIGATDNEIELVKRARELGVWVAVTDNHGNWDEAPAKRIADEAWDISWSDIDAMQAACIEASIDGAVAGWSEFRCENLIKLCNRMGWPCYITPEQLEVTRDKVKFKQACREYGVPVVREYVSPDCVDSFPVIVKPVDRAGSIGIGIAPNRASLEACYGTALTSSPTGRVIIEEFVGNQTKFDAFYLVSDGQVEFLTSDDVVNSSHNGVRRVVQSAWLLPSRYQSFFVGSAADKGLRSLIAGLGIRDGYIFFSGFTNGMSFRFFECGFRLCGSHLSGYLKRLGKPDILDVHICHALLGTTRPALEWVIPGDSGLKQATLNVYANAGKVQSITGFGAVADMPDCGYCVQRGRVGQCCEDDAAILDKIGMCYFVNRNPKVLAADVAKANEIIEVLDEDGRDMVHDRVDPAVIREWWNKDACDDKFKN